MYKKRALILFVATQLLVGLSVADDLTGVTDPTAPPHEATSKTYRSSAAGTPPLLLYSTQVASSSRSAVVNKQVVTLGSYIDGAVVTEIEPGQVTLARGSESIVLRLFLLPVKRPAKDAG